MKIDTSGSKDKTEVKESSRSTAFTVQNELQWSRIEQWKAQGSQDNQDS